MTVNTALNRRRVERRRTTLMRGVPEAESATSDAAGHADSEQLAELVRACLSELSEREREVFQMADLSGMSATAIASALGVQPVSVRSTLSRARRRIRIRMMEQHPHLLEEYDL